jgi:hypothetical protein
VGAFIFSYFGAVYINTLYRSRRGQSFPLGRGALQAHRTGSNLPVNSITLVLKLGIPSGTGTSSSSSKEVYQNLEPSALTLEQNPPAI